MPEVKNAPLVIVKLGWDKQRIIDMEGSAISRVVAPVVLINHLEGEPRLGFGLYKLEADGEVDICQSSLKTGNLLQSVRAVEIAEGVKYFGVNTLEIIYALAAQRLDPSKRQSVREILPAGIRERWNFLRRRKQVLDRGPDAVGLDSMLKILDENNQTQLNAVELLEELRAGRISATSRVSHLIQEGRRKWGSEIPPAGPIIRARHPLLEFFDLGSGNPRLVDKENK